MNYFLTLLSVFLETAKNVFSNIFSKNVLKNEADIYKFNTGMYSGSALILLFMLRSFEVSAYSVILAVIFALVTTTSQYFYLKALNLGTLSFSTFFSGCGLVIPTICGIFFWGEEPTKYQMIALPMLIISMALALQLGSKKLSVKWLFMSIGTLIFTGLIGVLQSLHQMSEYKGELMQFLFISFVFMALFNMIFCGVRGKINEKPTYKFKSRASVTAIVSGIFMGVVNILNLYLSGVMPKIIFFPLVNGGLIFVSLLAALVIFREKLSLKQWIGIILGIAALCMIGI